jgi:Ca2+-binding RTX toxin-like protein
LYGDAGNDVLEGMDGSDTLSDSGGNNLFNGGAGTDSLTGNTGNEFFIGGVGSDTHATNTGADIIAFNRGDGQDTVNASTGGDNTVSLGGGIAYADLTLSKSGDNLVLGLGSGESMTFADWYSSTSNRSVATLQAIVEASTDYDPMSSNPLLNKKIASFDFLGIVDYFDQAGSPSTWEVADALLDEHLASPETAALGGDLAYQYGRNGSLAGLALTPVQTILGDSQFGTAAQTLQPLSGLQEGLIKLS